MARRSYIKDVDKERMAHRRAGRPEMHEADIRRRGLINAIIESPSLGNIHRQWALGTKSADPFEPRRRHYKDIDELSWLITDPNDPNYSDEARKKAEKFIKEHNEGINEAVGKKFFDREPVGTLDDYAASRKTDLQKRREKDAKEGRKVKYRVIEKPRHAELIKDPENIKQKQLMTIAELLPEADRAKFKELKTAEEKISFLEHAGILT
jgi:hypothetical protein